MPRAKPGIAAQLSLAQSSITLSSKASDEPPPNVSGPLSGASFLILEICHLHALCAGNWPCGPQTGETPVFARLVRAHACLVLGEDVEQVRVP